MTALTRSQVIQRAYDEWERDWVGRIVITEVYEDEPEALVAMNASPEAEEDLARRTAEALAAAGFPLDRWSS